MTKETAEEVKKEEAEKPEEPKAPVEKKAKKEKPEEPKAPVHPKMLETKGLFSLMAVGAEFFIQNEHARRVTPLYATRGEAEAMLSALNRKQ